jgi:hypothetical protein
MTSDDSTTAPASNSAQRLAIEGPTSNPAQQGESSKDEIRVLDVGGGNVVKLDSLGPMIINSDGVRNYDILPGCRAYQLTFVLRHSPG